MLLDFGRQPQPFEFMSLLFLVLLAAANQPQALPQISPEVIAIVRQLEKASNPELVHQLEKLSAQQDDSATILLGEIYFIGLFGIQQDEDRGCDYFEPLASKYGEAAHNLATCHFRGNGKRKDQSSAREYYRSAVNLNWRDSSCALGNMMIGGQGGDKDVAGGLALCREAAEAGLPHAQADYGIYLLRGNVVPKDAIAARQWLTLAARQNHGNASFFLGLIYWNGDGVGKDRNAAAKWLKVAFENGRPDAAHLLAQEAMARLLIKDGEKTTIAPAVLHESVYWLEMTQKVEGQSEEKIKDRELLDTLYAFQAKRKKEE